jgi:uncharacterized protein YndB with AHSA1/START domain
MRARTSFTIPPDEPTIVIRRLFDAPPHLVFEASTRPEHLARWWGPCGSTLTQCQVDLRPGGAWRFVLRMPDGSEHGFGGVYREVTPPRRLVQTFRYDGFPDAEAVETVNLEEQDGKTLLTVTVRHKTIENRDGHVASGMEAGATESHERLAELLAERSETRDTRPTQAARKEDGRA